MMRLNTNTRVLMLAAVLFSCAVALSEAQRLPIGPVPALQKVRPIIDEGNYTHVPFSNFASTEEANASPQDAGYFNPARQFFVRFHEDSSLRRRSTPASAEEMSDVLNAHLEEHSPSWLESSLFLHAQAKLRKEAAPLRVEYVRPMGALEDVHVFSIPEDAGLGDGHELDMRTVLSVLSAHPEVALVEEDTWKFPLAVPTDPLYSQYQAWNLENANSIRARQVWDLGFTGSSSVKVAVLDTGILKTHPDLATQFIGGYDFISSATSSHDYDGRDPDASDAGDWCNGRGSSWHGSFTSSIIAAQTNNGGMAGINQAPQVIVPLRVLGACGGVTSDIIDAVAYAVGLPVSGMSPNPNPVKILNLSLGGGGACSATEASVYQAARNTGALIFVAAGNSNMDVDTTSPANCPGVISIVATDDNGSRAYYSNYGRNTKFSAPGGATGSGRPGVMGASNSGTSTPGNMGFIAGQGTSFAAPHAAGAAALIMSSNSALSTDDTLSLMLRTAATRGFPAGSNCFNTSLCGVGIIDAFAAVQLGQPPYDCATQTPWYRDADSDGWGDRANVKYACSRPLGYVDILHVGDCNDNDAGVNPSAKDDCSNSRDDNCDGVVNDGCGCQFNNIIAGSMDLSGLQAGATVTLASTNILRGSAITLANARVGVTYHITNCGFTSSDTIMTIYNSAGVAVATNDDMYLVNAVNGCQTQSMIQFKPTVAGNYILQVDEFACPAASTKSLGNAVLRIPETGTVYCPFTGLDILSPGMPSPSSTTVYGTAQGRNFYSGESALVMLVGGATYQIDTCQLSKAPGTTISVFSAIGLPIKTTSVGCGTDAKVTFFVPNTDNYLVQIDGAGCAGYIPSVPLSDLRIQTIPNASPTPVSSVAPTATRTPAAPSASPVAPSASSSPAAPSASRSPAAPSASQTPTASRSAAPSASRTPSASAPPSSSGTPSPSHTPIPSATPSPSNCCCCCNCNA